VDTATVLEPNQVETTSTRWSLSTRILFRFTLLYFALFCFCTQILGGLLSIPNVDIPDPSTLPPIRPIVEWAARHIFGIQQQLVVTGSGSGDKIFDWVLDVFLLTLAFGGTALWSILDLRRASYPVLSKWFRVFLRFALGSQMLTYGLVKLFPMQMPFPGLITLLEPYGHFSPMGVLWSFIGASPAYERLCGSVEILAGVLLLFPGLTLLGALVCAGVAMQIFLLNMTYDVPVKNLSFHLFLMACFLIAPDASRLIQFFVLDRAVNPSRQPPLFVGPRANRIAFWAQIVFAAWLVGSITYGTWTSWPKWGGGRPKSPLYGIWNVDEVSIDGHVRSSLLNDYGRWRRLIFESPEWISYQRMNDSFGYYNTSIDEKKQTITFSQDDDKNWKGSLHYQRTAPDRLVLDGQLGGHPTRMQLQLEDRNKLMLVSRGFHWVQEQPFNR